MMTRVGVVLVSNETTLMRMVTAYGMLVNGGKQIEPSFIDRIQNRYGETVFKRDTRECLACGPKIRWADYGDVPAILDTRAQVTTPQHAYQIVSILEGAVQRGTGTRLSNIGFPVAGKTGTTNEAKDTWFIGFTPNLVFGATVGFDQPRPLGRNETGSSVALPIVQSFLEDAFAADLIEPLPFRVPSGLNMMQINAKTGRRATLGDDKVIWEAFLNGQSPDQQQVIYGGETVIFEEPDINFADLFALPENQSENGTQPTRMYQIFDPNASSPNQGDLRQAPMPERPNPSLQGTGGIY